MPRVKITVLSIIVILFFLCSAEAALITLKSGKVIDGEIIERARDYIKVKYNEFEVYYENKYIKSIENQPADAVVGVRQKENAPQEEASFKKGLELASAGNLDEASQEFKKQLNDIKSGLSILDAVEKGSISREFAIYVFQGSLHIVNQEYNLAVTSFEKAWEINPKDPDVNFNLGFACYSLGEYEKSIIYLYAALKLQPDDIGAYELIAKAYCNVGEFQKAKENLVIAKELSEKNGDEKNVVHIDELLRVVAAVTP